MSLRYMDYMSTISSDKLHEGLFAHGMFTEKLPPIFTSENFFQFYKSTPDAFPKSLCQKPHGVIYFESWRNTNVPRLYAIPHPIAYYNLCQCLSDHWNELKTHFAQQTHAQSHKVSRIHIRKQKNSKSLFAMTYSNWKTDASPEPDLQIGNHDLDRAAISTGCQSMDTQSLPWALVGKPTAKQTKNDKTIWYNILDHKCMELKKGETHGFLIGPHTSNLLSEIILTAVDNKLVAAGWKYIRHIDDYTCYVLSYEKAQEFLIDLRSCLREYDLSLNHKKTKIIPLPIAAKPSWVYTLKTFQLIRREDHITYTGVQAYLDMAIGLMLTHDNTAIINYAIKMLEKQSLTQNAKSYCLKTMLHLSVIYPYLIPLLPEYVFKPYHAAPSQIRDISEIFYRSAIAAKNYEAAIYAIYFSLRYKFELSAVTVENAINSDSCLLKLFVWLYFEKTGDIDSMEKMRDHAAELAAQDFDGYWLFVYESLPEKLLVNEWQIMKHAGISFIQDV